jgi:hypothetical protein
MAYPWDDVTDEKDKLTGLDKVLNAVGEAPPPDPMRTMQIPGGSPVDPFRSIDFTSANVQGVPQSVPPPGALPDRDPSRAMLAESVRMSARALPARAVPPPGALPERTPGLNDRATIERDVLLQRDETKRLADRAVGMRADEAAQRSKDLAAAVEAGISTNRNMISSNENAIDSAERQKLLDSIEFGRREINPATGRPFLDDAAAARVLENAGKTNRLQYATGNTDAGGAIVRTFDQPDRLGKDKFGNDVRTTVSQAVKQSVPDWLESIKTGQKREKDAADLANAKSLGEGRDVQTEQRRLKLEQDRELAFQIENGKLKAVPATAPDGSNVGYWVGNRLVTPKEDIFALIHAAGQGAVPGKAAVPGLTVETKPATAAPVTQAPVAQTITPEAARAELARRRAGK